MAFAGGYCSLAWSSLPLGISLSLDCLLLPLLGVDPLAQRVHKDSSHTLGSVSSPSPPERRAVADTATGGLFPGTVPSACLESNLSGSGAAELCAEQSSLWKSAESWGILSSWQLEVAWEQLLSWRWTPSLLLSILM